MTKTKTYPAPRLDENGNCLANGECYICGNWGAEMIQVGLGVLRHDECGPGSEAWCQRYPDSWSAKRGRL